MKEQLQLFELPSPMHVAKMTLTFNYIDLDLDYRKVVGYPRKI